MIKLVFTNSKLFMHVNLCLVKEVVVKKQICNCLNRHYGQLFMAAILEVGVRTAKPIKGVFSI